MMLFELIIIILISLYTKPNSEEQVKYYVLFGSSCKYLLNHDCICGYWQSGSYFASVQPNQDIRGLLAE